MNGGNCRTATPNASNWKLGMGNWRTATATARFRYLMIVLALLCSSAAFTEDWAVEGVDARISLSVEADLYQREAPELSAVLDFNALLGCERTLKAGSLTLVETESGRRREISLSQQAQLRYASGNPVLRIRWTAEPLARFEDRYWGLYFATVQPGAEGAWEPLERTWTVGEPGVLWETSFEEADPEHDDRPVGMHPSGWDKEGETSERVWTDEEAHSGERSLKIARTFENGPPKNTNRPHWRTYPPRLFVRPGQNLRVSAWTKAPELEERSLPLVTLYFQDAEGKRLREGRTLLRGQRVASDEWAQVMGVVPAPQTAASASVNFSLHGEGVAYCDDLRVTVAPGARLPQLPVEIGSMIERSEVVADQEGPSPDEKVLRCGAAEEPPTIDGALDDACWASAGRVGDFIPFQQIPGTEVTTTVRACADEDALYFGFECTEPDTSELVAETTERDGPAWQDDSVELFLDTNRDRRTFYQIIVNPKGVFFDQDAGAEELAGPKWDGPITVATEVHPDRWVAEIRLAFTGLRLAEAEGQVWGANFARTSHRGGRSTYSWARVKKGFLEPENFGRLVLPFDPTANSVTGRVLAGETVYCGAGALPFEVTNRRDEAVEVTVRATRDGLTREVEATIGAGATEPVQVPMRFDEPSEARVTWELLERPSGTVLYTTALAHIVPEALSVQPDHLLTWVGESVLTGQWRLGLDESALADARVHLQVRAEDGTEVATTSIQPTATEGSYAVEVGDAGAGTYLLRARLTQNGEQLAESEIPLERMPGPFANRGD